MSDGTLTACDTNQDKNCVFCTNSPSAQAYCAQQPPPLTDWYRCTGTTCDPKQSATQPDGYTKGTCSPNPCTQPPPTDEYEIFGHYQGWGDCFTDYSQFDGGDIATKPFLTMMNLGITSVAYSFLLFSLRNTQKSPSGIIFQGLPGSDYLLLDGESGDIKTSTPAYAVLQKMKNLCTQLKKNFYIAFGGWSDETLFTDTAFDYATFGSYVGQFANALGAHVVLDFEHLSEKQQDIQIKNFTTLCQGIRKTLKDSLLLDLTTRFNGVYSSESKPPTENFTSYTSDNEVGLMNQYIDVNTVFQHIQIMAYDDPNTMLYDNIVSNFMTVIKDSTRLIMGVEIGRQEAGGVWYGIENDVTVATTIVQERLGGVMLWAVNYNVTKDQHNTGDLTHNCAQNIAPSIIKFYANYLNGGKTSFEMTSCVQNKDVSCCGDVKCPSGNDYISFSQLYGNNCTILYPNCS